MSRPRPITAGRERPVNLAVLMREAFIALNDLVIDRLAERGHADVRPAHGAVFQYLDDTGTTVSVLAERAQMTKQAMAELVRHLETHGYVERIPDPDDRRAKLVLPTEQGREVDRHRPKPGPRTRGPGHATFSAPNESLLYAPTWKRFAGWPATPIDHSTSTRVR